MMAPRASEALTGFGMGLLDIRSSMAALRWAVLAMPPVGRKGMRLLFICS